MNIPCGAGRGRPRDDAREQAILDAALQLLVEVGYERMSMVAVANLARASKATIYRRWASKDEMVIEALRRRAPIDSAPADTGSLRDDLLAQVRLMIKAASGPDGALLVGVLRAASESPELAAVIQDNMRQHKAEMCCCLLERAAKRGELAASADPGPLVEVITSMIFMRLLVTGEALDDAFVHHLVDELALPLIAGRAGLPAETVS
ncbi:TetR/AcrR family transcriptional regulator [Frankia sp. AgKG'84/4]|uniref:TetR/AcrR family transcriptional regulator n=1 Tax=Frankia sp. AgKG'84/4 TaxID=573490 RepID=UPI00200FCAFE|nr:TetR/AcrR family transcriptional regulator [Frankia sp. AgKG'84/4]MCL9795755.1 TetR/AcrR family transcriptional regulator [Frankia sp. AgKG'84/4]